MMMILITSFLQHANIEHEHSMKGVSRRRPWFVVAMVSAWLLSTVVSAAVGAAGRGSDECAAACRVRLPRRGPTSSR